MGKPKSKEDRFRDDSDESSGSDEGEQIGSEEESDTHSEAAKSGVGENSGNRLLPKSSKRSVGGGEVPNVGLRMATPIPSDSDVLLEIDKVTMSPRSAATSVLRVSGDCQCSQEPKDNRPTLVGRTGKSESWVEVDPGDDDDCVSMQPVNDRSFLNSPLPSIRELQEFDYVKGESLDPNYEWYWSRYSRAARQPQVLQSIIPDIPAAIGCRSAGNIKGPTEADEIRGPSMGKILDVLKIVCRATRLWCTKGHDSGYLVYSLDQINFLPVIGDIVCLWPMSKANVLAPDFQFLRHRMADFIHLFNRHALLSQIDLGAAKPNLYRLRFPSPRGSESSETGIQEIQNTLGGVHHRWNEGDKIAVVSGGSQNVFRYDSFPGIPADKAQKYMREKRDIYGSPRLEYPKDFEMVTALKRHNFRPAVNFRSEKVGRNGEPKPDTLASLSAEQEDLIAAANSGYEWRDAMSWDGIITTGTEAKPEARPYFNSNDEALLDAHQSACVSAYEHCSLAPTSLNHFSNLLNPMRHLGAWGIRLMSGYLSNGTGRVLPTPVNCDVDVWFAMLSKCGNAYERLALRQFVLEMVEDQLGEAPMFLFGKPTDRLRVQQLFDSICAPENENSVNRLVVDPTAFRTVARLKFNVGEKLIYNVNDAQASITRSQRSRRISFALDYREARNFHPGDFPELKGAVVDISPTDPSFHPQTCGYATAPYYYAPTPVIGEGSHPGFIWATTVRDVVPAAMRHPKAINGYGFAVTAATVDVLANRPKFPVRAEFKVESEGESFLSQESLADRSNRWHERTVVVGGQQAQELAKLLNVPYSGFPRMSYADLALWSESRDLDLRGNSGEPAEWVLIAVGCSNAYDDIGDINQPPGFNENDIDVAIVGQSTLLATIAFNLAERNHTTVHVKFPPRTSGMKSTQFHRQDFRSHHVQAKSAEVAEALGLVVMDLSEAVDKGVRDWGIDKPKPTDVYTLGDIRKVKVLQEVKKSLMKQVRVENGLDGRKFRQKALEAVLGKRSAQPLAFMELMEPRLDNRYGYVGYFLGNWEKFAEKAKSAGCRWLAALTFLQKLKDAYSFDRTRSVGVRGGESTEMMSVRFKPTNPLQVCSTYVHPKDEEKPKLNIVGAMEEGRYVCARLHRAITTRTKPGTDNFSHNYVKTPTQLGIDTLMTAAEEMYPDKSIPDPKLPPPRGNARAIKTEPSDSEPNGPTPEPPKVDNPKSKQPGKPAGSTLIPLSAEKAKPPSKQAKKIPDVQVMTTSVSDSTRSSRSQVKRKAADDDVREIEAPRSDKRLRGSSVGGSGSRGSSPRPPSPTKDDENLQKLRQLVLGEKGAKMSASQATDADMELAAELEERWKRFYPSCVPTEDHFELFVHSAMRRLRANGMYSKKNRAGLVRLRLESPLAEMFYESEVQPNPVRTSPRKPGMDGRIASPTVVMSRLTADDFNRHSESRASVTEPTAGGAKFPHHLSFKKEYVAGQIVPDVDQLHDYDLPPRDPKWSAGNGFGYRLSRFLANIHGRKEDEVCEKVRGLAYWWIAQETYLNIGAVPLRDVDVDVSEIDMLIIDNNSGLRSALARHPGVQLY